MTSSLLPCDESPSSQADETPGRGFMTIELLLEVIRPIRGVWRKPLPAFTVFQVPSAQSNRISKWHILGWRVLRFFKDFTSLQQFFFSLGETDFLLDDFQTESIPSSRREDVPENWE